MTTKKGDPTDIVLFLVMIFFLAVSLVVALFANTKIKEVIDTTVLNETAAYSHIETSFSNVNDYVVQRGFVLIFAILIIGILVSSFLIRVHPIFIFIYIITLAVAIFVAVFLANTYEALVLTDEFAAFSANYAMITFIMQHIVKILIGVGALSMIIIFGKIGGGGENI